MANSYKAVFRAIVLGYCCFVVYAKASCKKKSTLSADSLETIAISSEFVNEYDMSFLHLQKCPRSSRLCGFQLYDLNSGKASPIIHDCECPEDGHCVKLEKFNPKYVIFVCQNTLKEGDETIQMSLQTAKQPVKTNYLNLGRTLEEFDAFVKAMHETRHRKESEAKRHAAESISFAISDTIDNMHTESVFEDEKSTGSTTELDISQVQTGDYLVAESAFDSSRGYTIEENVHNTYVTSSDFKRTFEPEHLDSIAKLRTDDHDKDEL